MTKKWCDFGFFGRGEDISHKCRGVSSWVEITNEFYFAIGKSYHEDRGGGLDTKLCI